MKIIAVLSILLFSAGSAFAEWIPPYHIKSDSLNSAVPEGKTLVSGIITDYGDQIIGEGIVGTTDFKYQTKVKEDGTYSFEIPSTYTDIFFFALGREEVVLYNYAFKSQHAVFIQFLSGASGQVIEMEKPVIYAYSDKPIHAELSLSVRGELTFTYPLLLDKWEFTTSPSGTITLDDGSSYPYLFWEGQKDDVHYQTSNNLIEGYLIKSDTTVSFLEHILDAYGLNVTEKTDFITYWGPRMIQKKYVLVQFLTDADYDKRIAAININPKPDAILRLFMLFTPLDKPLKYIPVTQTPSKLNRKGFTLVEWGGAEIPLLTE